MSYKPDSLRSKLRDALAAVTDPLGATFVQLQELTGIGPAQLSRVVHSLGNTKQIWLVNRGRHTRYFATEAQRDSAAPAVHALVDKLIVQVRAVNDKKKADRYREKMAAKQPKPARAPKSPKKERVVTKKACMPANVTIKSREPALNFKSQKAIIPKHIKVKVCPHEVDMRYKFQPPKGWTGEVTKAWLAERNQSKGMT